MKAKLLVIVIAVLLALSFPMAGSASMFHHTYKGQVVSYDQTGNMIVVNGKHGERTFDVSTATMKGMIQVNERVVVKYNKKGGRMIASSVKVTEPPPIEGGPGGMK